MALQALHVLIVSLFAYATARSLANVSDPVDQSLTGSNSTLEDQDNSTYPDWRVFYRQRLNNFREKEEQLILIQLRILNGLGISQPPNASKSVFTKQEKQKMKEMFNMAINITEDEFSKEQPYVQRIQSFYPSCLFPVENDRKLWERSNKFYTYYTADQALGDKVDITSATLRLWKYEEVGSSDGYQEDSEVFHPWFGASDSQENPEDGVYKTTIYAIVQPLKNSKRVKRKFVVSKTLTSKDSGWQEFDVKSAVKDWRNGRGNFGLEVLVEDAFGKTVDPYGIYSHINCSSSETRIFKPIPSFIQNLRKLDLLSENDSFPLDNKTYPILDLHTVIKEHAEPTGKGQIQRVIPISKVFNQSFGFEDAAVNRDKRSPSCSCQNNDYEFSIEELGLGFLTAPEVFQVSVCGITEGYQASEEYECIARNTSGIEFQYTDDSGVSRNITVDDINDQDCECIIKMEN